MQFLCLLLISLIIFLMNITVLRRSGVLKWTQFGEYQLSVRFLGCEIDHVWGIWEQGHIWVKTMFFLLSATFRIICHLWEDWHVWDCYIYVIILFISYVCTLTNQSILWIVFVFKGGGKCCINLNIGFYSTAMCFIYNELECTYILFLKYFRIVGQS